MGFPQTRFPVLLYFVGQHFAVAGDIEFLALICYYLGYLPDLLGQVETQFSQEFI
jgi:hypothetical protein